MRVGEFEDPGEALGRRHVFHQQAFRDDRGPGERESADRFLETLVDANKAYAKLAKELPDTRKADKLPKEGPKMPAGSFALDLNKKEHSETPGTGQKKRNKKQKQRRERPPWRR